MKIFRHIIIALAATVSASAAPTHRMTGIKWDVVPGEGVCRLESRIFGGEFADRVIVAGTPGVSPQREFGIQPLIQPAKGKMFTAAYAVGGEAPKQTNLLPRDGRKDPKSPLFVRLYPADYMRIIGGEPLLLGFVNGEVVQVETEGIAATEKALETCNNAAMSKALGMPIDLSLLAPAKLSNFLALHGIFTSSDYPDEALYKGIMGRVTFLAGLNTSGKIAACVTLESSGSDLLDRRTCEIVKRRAKIDPRTDRAGAPVNAPIITSVVFWQDNSTPERTTGNGLL